MEFRIEEKARFKNPEEEIAYLREELARREGALHREPNTAEKEALTKATLSAYERVPAEKVLAPTYQAPREEHEGISLRLDPEKHDATMEELLGYIQEKGIKNALSLIERIGNPHITDDAHRFLVQYLIAAKDTKSISERDPLYRELHARLYRIALPKWKGGESDKTKALKELLSAMEQFYAGMMSVAGAGTYNPEKYYFTIEIANKNVGKEVVFYVSVPESKINLFFNHTHAIFPDALITEEFNDYNSFNDEGASVGAYATPSKSPVLPIRTYDEFDQDPLNAILSAFDRIEEQGEGAAIQIVIAPAGDHFVRKYGKALEDVRNGVPTSYALDIPETLGGKVAKKATKMLFGAGKSNKDATKGGETRDNPLDDITIEAIKKKTGRTILNTNIRIIASAATQERASAILDDITSAFHQFGNSQGNSITFKTLKGRAALGFFKEFSYRVWDGAHAFPLNLSELTTILHFPVRDTSSSILHTAKAGTAPAPSDLPKSGVLIGVNQYHGVDTPVYMTDADRIRHFYTVGQTGTGKTNIFKNMIIQDIQAGKGVCMIDPHGNDIQDVLAHIPKERIDDVIYFDPGNIERPMGLNMLEFDPRYPEQKTLIVDELFGIFKKLYGAIPESMGPAFEQYFRASALLVMEHPESGSTLMEILRVLSDKHFRDLKLSHAKNPQIVMFWQNAERTTGEQGLANYVPYVSSKFDIFIQNEIMRPVVGQEKSAFNMRDIMDHKKIFLVNLAKGRLGDINSHLIGLVLVGKILMAALSRVDSKGQNLPDFYLYLDEFQNITTSSIATILSEARKYGLSLHIAHQFIGQLEDDIKDAVFGNVGSIAAFRVGADDAEFLEKQFAPVFSVNDLINIDNYNAYVKLLSNGRPLAPFSIATIAPERGNPDIVGKIKELSYLKYGRPRAEVEAEIMNRFRTA